MSDDTMGASNEMLSLDFTGLPLGDDKQLQRILDRVIEIFRDEQIETMVSLKIGAAIMVASLGEAGVLSSMAPFVAKLQEAIDLIKKHKEWS